jgi:phosphatidylinositol alpha-1,6-mannosyltransferase
VHGLLKVLVLASEFPPGPGGIGTHAYHVAQELHARGWLVQVCAPQDHASNQAIATFNRELPFVVHRLQRFGIGPVKLAHRIAAVSGIVRRDRPDIILASGERMVWLAPILYKLHAIPFVAVGHAMEFNTTPRWEYFISRRSFEMALGVVCVSRYTWSRMESCNIEPRRGAVIPNGADESRFRLIANETTLDFRRRHGFSKDARLLITVGSVHERKGQDVVIRSLPRVLERIPDAHYIVVGMPYRRDAFMQIARDVKVEDRVRFLGAVDNDELVAALNAANLFVMASQHTAEGDFEGFGIAVLEAALCGRAAVVSDQSGVVEAIVPDETGLVAKMGDPSSTADRIIGPERQPARRYGSARTRTRARKHVAMSWISI